MGEEQKAIGAADGDSVDGLHPRRDRAMQGVLITLLSSLVLTMGIAQVQTGLVSADSTSRNVPQNNVNRKL